VDLDSIPLDAQTSAVALTARTRQAVNVKDMAGSTTYRPVKQLPETLSELAIPLMLGSQLLGVFDLHAKEVNRFSEEISAY